MSYKIMGTTVIRQVSAERRREHSKGLSGDFRRAFLDIVENDILAMQRFLDVSRFLYSGGLWGLAGNNHLVGFHD